MDAIKPMHSTTVRNNIVSLGFLQIANLTAPLITSLYLIRIIGPDRFGLISFSLAVVTYFSIVTDFGFNFTAVRDVSINRHDLIKLNHVYSSIMYAKLGLLCLCMLVLFLAIGFFDNLNSEKLLFILTFGTVVGQVLLPTWLLQGLEDLRFSSLVVIAGKLISVGFVFFMIKSPSDYVYFPLINSAISIAISLYLILHVKKKYGIAFEAVRLNDICDQLKKSSTLFLANVSSSVYTVSITVALGVTSGNQSVGYFSAADKIIQASKGLFYPVMQAVYPSIAKRFHDDVRLGFDFIRKISIPLGAAMLGVCVVIFLSAPYLIHLLFGAGYDKSIPILQIMAFLPFVIFLSNVFGVQILINLNQGHVFRNILAICSLLCILICIPMILNFDEIGAAITILFVEMLITFLMICAVMVGCKNKLKI